MRLWSAENCDHAGQQISVSEDETPLLTQRWGPFQDEGSVLTVC